MIQGQLPVARDPLECARAMLLGSRWDCTPSDGMVSAYLGSCTIR